MAQFLPALVPVRDENGNALAGAVWEFYLKGTSTPAVIEGGSSSITADDLGNFATANLLSTTSYGAIAKSADGKTVFQIASSDASTFDAGVQAALDASNNTISGATWSFYTSGTTTPEAVYTDPELEVSLGSVVEADANGIFPEVYLDEAVTYKAVPDWLTADDIIDPVTDENMGTFLDPNYVPPTAMKFSGSGYRWPVTSQNHATNQYFAVEWHHHTPDYETSEIRFGIGAFWSPSSGGETLIDAAESIVIQGVSVELGTDNWVSCDGAAEGGVATLTAANPNALLPQIDTTLSANTSYRIRLTFVASSTSMDIPRNSLAPSGDAPGGQGRVEGSTTTRFGRLSESSNLSNGGGVYFTPGFCIARGGETRKSVLVTGDSIGYGSNDSLSPANFTSDNAVGFIERGLLDNTATQKLPNHIMCIPGQEPVGTGGWVNQSNWSNKIACLDLVNTAYGQYPFDLVLNQHITNSVPHSGNLQTDMAAFFDLLTTLFNRPITGLEGISRVSSSDGYATTANQTPSSGYDQTSTNTAHLWPYNDALRAGDFSSNGVANTIAPWEKLAVDTGSNRDIYPVETFSSTLASAYSSGNSVDVNDEPNVGAAFIMLQDDGDYGNERAIRTVTDNGDGTYTVGLSGSPGGAASSGNAVREVWGDDLHPSSLNHIKMAVAITDWKTAQGYVG